MIRRSLKRSLKSPGDRLETGFIEPVYGKRSRKKAVTMVKLVKWKMGDEVGWGIFG